MADRFNKRTPLVIVTALLIILGFCCGWVCADVLGEGYVKELFTMDVTLAEDAEVMDLDKLISGGGSEDQYYTDLPAGTSGKISTEITDFNAGRSYVSLNATFYLESGKDIKIQITNSPSRINEANYIDIQKLESYQTVIDEYNKALQSFEYKWETRQIRGGLFGLIISAAIAAILWLIRKCCRLKNTSAVLFTVATVIDIALAICIPFILFYLTGAI